MTLEEREIELIQTQYEIDWFINLNKKGIHLMKYTQNLSILLSISPLQKFMKLLKKFYPGNKFVGKFQLLMDFTDKF